MTWIYKVTISDRTGKLTTYFSRPPSRQELLKALTPSPYAHNQDVPYMENILEVIRRCDIPIFNDKNENMYEIRFCQKGSICFLRIGMCILEETTPDFLPEDIE